MKTMTRDRQELAVFLSRTSALNAILHEGKKRGVYDQILQISGHVHQVFKRGQFVGYHAYWPDLWGHTWPIYEEDM